jgi:hypothetical protein
MQAKEWLQCIRKIFAGSMYTNLQVTLIWVMKLLFVALNDAPYIGCLQNFICGLSTQISQSIRKKS